MENEKILEMIKMRMDGATLDEIAQKYGVSRESVRERMPIFLAEAKGLKRSYGNVVYPGIRSWMARNMVNKTSFSKKLGIDIGRLTRILKGVSDVKKSYIDKILAVTGMTYEEAFSEKDEGDFEKC